MTDSPLILEVTDYLAKLTPAERETARKQIDAGVKLKVPAGELPRADGLPEPAALDLDFDAEPEPPAYVVEGMFEVETVNLVSGDTGAAKSILFQDMTVAAATGRPWIGRQVFAARVLYIDAENPRRTVLRRLRALGARNEHRAAFRYYNRQGIELGTDAWNAWLHAEIEDFRPDLVIVDTAMSATAAEVNENDSVVSLYKALRPIVSELGTCAVILHHNRKDAPGGGHPRDASQAAMGARQWAGQADQQFTIRVNGDLELKPREDGGEDTRREFIIEGGKDREGVDSRPELVVVTSRRGTARALLTMNVATEGHVERESHTSKKDQTADEIVSFAREAEPGRELSTAEIAEGIGCDPNDGTFKAALRSCHTGKKARLVKAKKGRYEAAGRKRSGGLEMA